MDQVRLSTDENKVNVPKSSARNSVLHIHVCILTLLKNFFCLAEFSLVVTADGCLYAFGCCEKVFTACHSAIPSL